MNNILFISFMPQVAPIYWNLTMLLNFIINVMFMVNWLSNKKITMKITKKSNNHIKYMW